MNQEDFSVEDFIAGVNHTRLIYLKRLRLLGYQVSDTEIAELEKEVYPDLNSTGSKGKGFLNKKSIDELQLLLSLQEPQPSASNIKAQLYRLERTVVRMRRESNHQRPHFHIEYKKEYNASYAIDTLEKLAGEMPSKYERPILNWASMNLQLLKSAWEQLQSGGSIQEIIARENEA